MGLHLAIGFTEQGASALPFLVYVGKDKSDMLAAMEGSNAVRFEIISNVTGVRKNNPRHDGSKAPNALLPLLATVAAIELAKGRDHEVKCADIALHEAVKAVEGCKAERDAAKSLAEGAAEDQKEAANEAYAAASTALKEAESEHGKAVDAFNAAVAVAKVANSDADRLVKADKARGVRFTK